MNIGVKCNNIEADCWSEKMAELKSSLQQWDSIRAQVERLKQRRDSIRNKIKRLEGCL